MKRINKKFILITALSGTLLFTGCNKFSFGTFDASKDEVSSEITAVPDDNQDDVQASDKDEQTDGDISAENSSEAADTAENNELTTDNTTPTPDAIKPSSNIELPIYIVNAETGEKELVTAMIPKDSEITPELIVNTVVDSMADQSIIIGIDSVDTEDDKVIVSFQKDKAPYTNLGSGYEGAILDAIAQSIIDNLGDNSKVIFRVEGKAYEGGAYEFGIDDVYLGDN